MTKKQALQSFISEITKKEGGKSQVHIGDAREVLKLINQKLGGIVYDAILLRESVKKEK